MTSRVSAQKMAGARVDVTKNKCPNVFLGYIDEKITEKYTAGVDFTTSKIGGSPVKLVFNISGFLSQSLTTFSVIQDWILNTLPSLSCDLCNSDLRLITQIYAPLEHSSFHRTLYVLACTQPMCWTQPGR